ncbi:hypothetical protein ES708_11580 [subsurface metagenome]
MTLEQAIANQYSIINCLDVFIYPEDKASMMMSIEALKREKYGRVQQPANVIRLLPGETEN